MNTQIIGFTFEMTSFWFSEFYSFSNSYFCSIFKFCLIIPTQIRFHTGCLSCCPWNKNTQHTCTLYSYPEQCGVWPRGRQGWTPRTWWGPRRSPGRSPPPGREKSPWRQKATKLQTCNRNKKKKTKPALTSEKWVWRITNDDSVVMKFNKSCAVSNEPHGHQDDHLQYGQVKN